jgi:hypothetical protein
MNRKDETKDKIEVEAYDNVRTQHTHICTHTNRHTKINTHTHTPRSLPPTHTHTHTHYGYLACDC